jgi:DNA-binding transcriptional ArsR family regulator
MISLHYFHNPRQGRRPWPAVGTPNAPATTFNPMVDDPPGLRQCCAMSDPLSQTFAALADPTRRSILAMLLEDDMAVTDVAEPFAMSLAAISKHLSVLADAGLISRERRGRVIWCKLEPDALKSASVWMQGFGQFDPVDLDALERFLETELSDPFIPAEISHGGPGV